KVGGAPVRGAEGALEARGGREGVAGPGEEGVALGHDPVRRAVEVEDGEGRRRGLCGDEGGYGRRGGDALVGEGDAEEGAGEGREDRERGLGLWSSASDSVLQLQGVRGGEADGLGVPRHGDEGAAPRIELLRRRKRNGQERVRAPQYLEPSIYNH